MTARVGLSPSELIDLVHKTVADRDSWEPHVRFDAGERYCYLLRSDDLVDIWLLTWLPGQATTLHDHGGSAAALHVVQGSLHEDHADRLGHIENHEINPGDVHWLAPDAVHDVYNCHDPAAVSIHAYSPPLASMTFYRRGPGGLEAIRTVPTREPEADL